MSISDEMYFELKKENEEQASLLEIYAKQNNEIFVREAALLARVERLTLALEKISKYTERIEYRCKDHAVYEPSETAKIAQKALSEDKQ